MSVVITLFSKGPEDKVKSITSSDGKFEAVEGLPDFVKIRGKKSGSSKERTFGIRASMIDEIEFVEVEPSTAAEG